MKFYGWREEYFGYKMLCVTSTGCTSLGETCYTFCNIYRIRKHWLRGHAPEVTAIIATLYAANTAYSRNDSFLPSWTICHLSERKQVCEENVWIFFSFFLPYDSKQSAVSAISPLYPCHSGGKSLVASKYILCILKFYLNICIICVREALLPMQKNMVSWTEAKSRKPAVLWTYCTSNKINFLNA